MGFDHMPVYTQIGVFIGLYNCHAKYVPKPQRADSIVTASIYMGFLGETGAV